MTGIVKTKIEYSWDRKELFEKAKQQLLSEGWIVINETLPAIIEHVKSTDTFVCWFQREFKF